MNDVNLVTQGAEGRVFNAKYLGKNVIIKHRFKKTYRHPDLDDYITKERIKAEVKSLVRCRMVGINVPALYDVNLHASELVMENLDDAIQARKFIYERKADKSEVLGIGKEIGAVLAKLHSNDIVHGDLTTSNILIRPSSEKPIVYLIDFGLSYVSDKIEDKAVDLYVLERAVLSTHPDSDGFLEVLWEAYREKGGKKLNSVLLKLDEVRTRGRKKLCFG
ncbi:UNVERIFIED_CONTAM: hypothetical protein RMT77_007185 [Armadillidium vulgare]